jgi:hypothetical protein
VAVVLAVPAAGVALSVVVTVPLCACTADSGLVGTPETVVCTTVAGATFATSVELADP